MPKIDMKEYNATDTAGGFKQLVPGAYVVAIQAVRTEFEEMDWDLGDRVKRSADKDRAVMFVFDIAEGDFLGEFSRDFYLGVDGKLDERKDWMHSVKYDWSDMRSFKRFNQALEESNPGFDTMAAFQADRWDMYVGKKFGLVLNGTVSTNDRGYDSWRLRAGKGIYTVDDIHDGRTPEPRIQDKRVKENAPEPTAVYDDIPFI